MSRRWLVWAGGTPIAPECPLSWQDAAEIFGLEASQPHVETLEIRQCTHEELVWAGVAT